MKRANRILASLLAGIAALGLSAELFLPRLISSAYRGDSSPVLNRLISGRSQHSLAYYQDYGRTRARQAALLGAGLALLLWLPLQPRVARRLLAWLPPEDPGVPEPDPPPRRRRAAVYGAAALLLGGSLCEIATGPAEHREHWPFSPYTMYAALNTSPSLTVRRLFGVTRDTPPRELPLFEGRFIRPFDNPRLWFSLDRMNRSRDRERLLREALFDCLRRYEARRRAGGHHGPPLSRVRLYQLRWELDPHARNREAPERELLLEVTSRNPDEPSS